MISAALAGGASTDLEMSGSGTAVLAGANTYEGDTLVTAGTLLGGSGGSSVSPVTVSDGAAFGVAITEENGQWSGGDVTFEDESTIVIEYGSSAPSKTTAPLAVENLTLGSDLAVTIPEDSLDLLEVGETYPLITWTGSGPADASDITSFVAFRTFADLSVADNTLSMTITASAPGPIAWNTGDGIWDDSTANWIDVQDNSTIYFDGLDTVHFGDVATVDEDEPIEVTLDSVFSPAEMIVESAEHDYTIDGTGRLDGPTPITVDIPANRLFRLGMVNTHTGGIEVESGTLRPLTNQSLGPNGSSITVREGGTLDFDGTAASRDYRGFIAGDGVDGTGAVINNTGNLQQGFGSLTLLDDASIGATTRWDVRPPGTGEVNLNGFNLTKLGEGKIALIQGVFSGDGTITVEEGILGLTRNVIDQDLPIIVNNGATLQFENYSTGSFSKPVIVNGSTLWVSGAAVTNPRSVTVTGESIFQIAAPFTLGNGLAGDGSVTKTAGQTLTIDGESTHTGSITIESGQVALGASGSIPTTSRVTINPGATFNSTAVTDYAVPAGQEIEFVIDPDGSGESGVIEAEGLDVSGASAMFDALDALDGPAYVLATYTSLTGSPFASVSAPPGYAVDYNFEGNQIALVEVQVEADYLAWASQFPGLDLSDPNADSNGNGLTNNQQRLFGLDPTDPTAVNPVVVPFDEADGTLSFSRRDPMLTGYDYEVWTSTDLVAWTVDEGAVLMPGAVEDDVQIVDVELSPALLEEPRLFVRIGATEPEPLLSEDFEDGAGGFTVVTASGTSWELGTPNSPDEGGGSLTNANSGTQCWGINLNGTYAADTDTSLRSPVIDLTEVASANLEFALAIDAAPGHSLAVNVIEAAGDGVIGVVIPSITDPDDTVLDWSTIGPMALPPEAFGQEVRLEWRFVGDGDGFYNGVYIDDVKLTR